jgi:hypothetical protein
MEFTERINTKHTLDLILDVYCKLHIASPGYSSVEGFCYDSNEHGGYITGKEVPQKFNLVKQIWRMRFQVLKAVSIKMTVIHPDDGGSTNL